MLEILLVIVAVAVHAGASAGAGAGSGGGGGGGGGQPETLRLDPAPAIGPGASEAPPDYVASVAETPAPLPYAAEPQVQTGRFLTALEVKPILGATRANWVAVREWDGQDLVYVTHLWSWRCGLVAIRGAVNDAPLQDWPLPACHEDTAQPNAMLEGDGPPYLSYPLASVQTVTVELIYDDLTTDKATFNRLGVLLP